MNPITASIVVPVYNSERYLEESIRSALSQTCKSIEVICVDNGSTDGSYALLERLAREDARVRVISEPRPGVSCARNAGMACARGEYLFFLDADDLMKPECVERAVACAGERDAQVVIYSFACFYAEAGVEIGAWPCPEETLFDRAFAVRDIKGPVTFAVTPNVWRIAFRRDFVQAKGLSYPEELRTSEDLVFVYEALFSADRIALMREELYRYRRDRGGSLTRKDRQAAGLRALDLIAQRVDATLRSEPWFVRQFLIVVLDTFEYQLQSSATSEEFKTLFAGYQEKWRAFADEHASMIPERYRFFYEGAASGDAQDYLFRLYARERAGVEQRDSDIAGLRRACDEAAARSEKTAAELAGVYASKSWRLVRGVARMLGK